MGMRGEAFTVVRLLFKLIWGGLVMRGIPVGLVRNYLFGDVSLAVRGLDGIGSFLALARLLSLRSLLILFELETGDGMYFLAVIGLGGV